MITAISEGRELEGEAAERYQKICKERRKITDVDELPTCFPTGMLLGSTWNPETVEQCGRAVGREAHCFGVNILMGSPDANIQRDPRGGTRIRVLYGRSMCDEYARPCNGARGPERGRLCQRKHFAANNQETARLKINETISERALREIYFPGFRACVEQSGLKTIMCAYNHINGVGCSMNRWLLRDVLRGEWGFKGMVMSDWGGVYDQVQAVRAGNDLDMPGVRDMAPVREALENGQLSMEEVDFCVRNILTSLAENPSLQEPSRKKLDKCFSAEAAYHAAVEGFVLLKNDGALPLREPCKLALFGEGCKQFITTSRQSSRVFSYKQPRLLEELETRLGKDNVRFEELPTHADAVLITVQSLGTEGKDRPDLQIDAEQRAMLERGLDAARRAARLPSCCSTSPRRSISVAMLSASTPSLLYIIRALRARGRWRTCYLERSLPVATFLSPIPAVWKTARPTASSREPVTVRYIMRISTSAIAITISKMFPRSTHSAMDCRIRRSPFPMPVSTWHRSIRILPADARCTSISTLR